MNTVEVLAAYFDVPANTDRWLPSGGRTVDRPVGTIATVRQPWTVRRCSRPR